jgi:hypothetical protein
MYGPPSFQNPERTTLNSHVVTVTALDPDLAVKDAVGLALLDELAHLGLDVLLAEERLIGGESTVAGRH